MKNPCYLSLLLAAAVATFTSCSPPKPAPPPPPKVTVANPQRMTVTNWDEYPGHIEAVEQVDIRARVSGYLESIHFEDGADVKAGDLLFVIDPKPYQAELDRATASMNQAETRLELARNDLKRAEALRGTKAISDEELDSRSKAAREAEDAVKAARATEGAAKLNVSYTRITAPVSGRISRRLVTVGNLVQANGTPLLTTLVSLAPIYCYFDVQEDSFLRYRHYMAERADKSAPPCELKLAGEEGFTHQGRLDFFDNQVDPKTGTIRLRAVFPNADHALVPGMFATVRLLAGPPSEALAIPDTAVISDQSYKFAYVVNQTNVVEAVRVKLGRAQGPWRAVLEGLTPQDRVITNGLAMVRRGAKVEAQTAAEAAAAPRAQTK